MPPTYGLNTGRLGYGYVTPQTAARPAQPLRYNQLAMAASGKSATPTDPFGLTTGQAGAKGYFNVNPVQPATPQSTVVPPATTPGVSPPPATNTAAAPPPPGTVFDINNDAGLQGANALLGMTDAQSKSVALSMKQQKLLGYGDPALIQHVLSDPLLAEAAVQNPTSTLAQLRQQHDRGLTDMTENFNKQSLLYSGARVKGEQQFGEDYQNALASAASDVSGALSGIDSNLAQALASTNAQRVQALTDAYNRHANDPGVTPPPPGGTDDGGASNLPPTAADDSYWRLLALAAATHRPVNA